MNDNHIINELIDMVVLDKKLQEELNGMFTGKKRAKEIGMMASRLSKEKGIQIIKEDNLDGRYQNKISYYHENILKEVFDLIF